MKDKYRSSLVGTRRSGGPVQTGPVQAGVSFRRGENLGVVETADQEEERRHRERLRDLVVFDIDDAQRLKRRRLEQIAYSKRPRR